MVVSGKHYEISSLTNDKIKLINSLYHRKYRRDLKLFVAEGVRICKEALDNNWKIKYLLFDKNNKDNLAIKDLVNVTTSLGADAIGVSLQLLSKLSHKDNPQNVLGVFEQRWNDLPKCINNKRFVALESIRDPGNLGTILRTMDGMGASDCILLNECTDPFSYEAVRASMGAIFNINITASNFERFFKWKSDKNISLIGTSLKKASHYTKANWEKPFVLAMGNEQNGLSDTLINNCDQLIKIPMLGKSDSLNLAVSTGIILYESVRKNPN